MAKSLQGEIMFRDDNTAELITPDGEKIIIDDTEYNAIPTPIYKDPNIFTEEVLEKYNSLPSYERANFVIEIIDDFYRKNPEYAVFAHETIYKDPDALLEFFYNIKKSHFKKAGISDKNFSAFQKKLEEVEIEIANNPINYDDIQLVQIWPLLSLRDYFLESDLAALYYIQNPKAENALTEIISDFDYYQLPFGPWLFPANEAINYIAANRDINFYLTSTNKKKNDRSKLVMARVDKKNNGYELTHKKKDITSTITILNTTLIESKSAVKLLAFLLAKAAQQNFNPVIIFSLQELVNIGWYSNTTNARAGFKKNMQAVHSLQIGGEMKKGKKQIIQEAGVLFYHYDIDNNIVKVWVNDNFNLEFIASYYTILPYWAWTLNDNAFRILLEIFTISRVNKKKEVNLSLSLIRDNLSLPTREEYAVKGKKFKAKQYVKKPITDAIDEIIAVIDQNNDHTIKIEPHYIIDDNNLDEWLKGYITVIISGDYTEKLQEIQTKQIKVIETNKKRKEEAEIKARLKVQLKEEK